MKKMGKWLLSLMVAVSLTMPVLADVNVQSTGTEFASEIGAAELQADTEQAIESQTEAEPESQTEPEEQTEEQTEDPVDVELDDYLNTSVVLQNASSIGFDRVQIQWQPFSLLEVEGYRIYRKTANSKWAVLADVTDTSYDVLTGAKNVEGADGFYVYRKTNNGKWEKIDDCPVFIGSNAGPLYEKAEQTLFRDSTVRPGNIYTYTCRAYCKVNGKIILSGYDPKGSSVTVK